MPFVSNEPFFYTEPSLVWSGLVLGPVELPIPFQWGINKNSMNTFEWMAVCRQYTGGGETETRTCSIGCHWTSAAAKGQPRTIIADPEWSKPVLRDGQQLNYANKVQTTRGTVDWNGTVAVVCGGWRRKLEKTSLIYALDTVQCGVMQPAVHRTGRWKTERPCPWTF